MADQTMFTMRMTAAVRSDLNLIASDMQRKPGDALRQIITECAKKLKSSSRTKVSAASMGGSDDARQGVQA